MVQEVGGSNPSLVKLATGKISVDPAVKGRIRKERGRNALCLSYPVLKL